MLELVAFLGNHGHEYHNHRHNVAWLLSEYEPFASLARRRKFQGWYASTDRSELRLALTPAKTGETAADERSVVHFLWPETYMNRSGQAIRAASDFFKIKTDHFIAVHDDLELPFGVVSLKFSGGLGGHNGLRSLKAYLGSADYWRLRIGIGRPNHSDIAGYVLSNFSEAEQPFLDKILSASAEVLRLALLQNPENLLTDWKKKQLLE